MKEFCIPKHLAAELKQAAVKGEINIQELYGMNSAERKSVFEKYTDKTTAQNINTGFEEAIMSAQKDSLKKWAEKTFVGGKKTKQYTDVLTKIEELETIGVLDSNNQQEFLEDLVGARLGVSISKTELETLNKFSDELEVLNPITQIEKQLQSGEITKKESEELIEGAKRKNYGLNSIEYLKKRRELNNYIESLTPSNKLKVLVSVGGRGMMLASFKSFLLNIESNTVTGILEAATRRFATMQFLGIANPVTFERSKDYIKFAMEAYDKSGYDITRSSEMQFTPKSLGESYSTTQGKGKIRAFTRIVEDIVFKNILGKWDVLFSAITRADSANIQASMLAKQEGLKGEEYNSRVKQLVDEAFNFNEMSDEGQRIKERSIQDSLRATFQNDSITAKTALMLRDVIDKATGSIGVGEILMPFVKTPANVVQLGLNYSVGGIIEGSYQLLQAKKAKQNGDVDAFREHSFRGAENFIRSGIGITVGLIIAGMFNPDDDEFVGDYPENLNDRELFKLKNAVENSVRIGDKYISLDYLGPLGLVVRGILTAKRNQGDPAKAAITFLTGTAQQLETVPGYEETSNLLDAFSSLIQDIKTKNGEETANKVTNAVIDMITARVVPAMISDVSKTIDPNKKDVDYKSSIEYLKSKIPFLSSTLPNKTDTLGDQQKYEITQILFGSRVKTKKQDEIIDELIRLEQEGFTPSLGDVEKSTKVTSMKSKLGEEKYNEMLQSFKENLKLEYEKIMDSKSYKKGDDAIKKKLLDDGRTDLRERVIKKYGYKDKK